MGYGIGTGPPGVGVLQMSVGPSDTDVCTVATLATNLPWFMSGIGLTPRLAEKGAPEKPRAPHRSPDVACLRERRTPSVRVAPAVKLAGIGVCGALAHEERRCRSASS